MNSRINRVMEELQHMGLQQMLVTDPMAIDYLTGYFNEPFERFMALLLKADGSHVMFLNTLFPKPDCPLKQVWFTDTDDVTPFVAAEVDATLPLGVDKDLKARFLLPLMDAGAATGYVNASLAIDLTRAVKDAEEQEYMREASSINDAGMAEFVKLIHDGVTEKSVAEQIPAIYMQLGADGLSFPPIVSFGANAADPHHMPDDTLLKEGDCVLFDVGCMKKGYCSDMTRTFYYKSVTEEEREIYNLVLAANMEAEKIAAPGEPICNLDNTARGIITAGGHGPEFTHRLGHFIGRADHEYGDVSSANTWPAKPGMCFSVEPGIYVEGNTGVRIEDLVLITEDGAEILNRYPKNLQIIE